MEKVTSKFRYLHLIREIAVTDFKLKYQRSFFGYLWSLVNPLAYFAVLYFVFTRIFKIGSNIPHYPIYLLLGVMIFMFFGEATSVGMYSIANKGDLIRKIYFPRIVLVIASTLTSFITFLLNLLVLGTFAYFTGVRFGLDTLLIIPLILELYVFILGVSFYLAALFVRFRDIGHIWQVFNQILFYATPIVYALTAVPNNLARFIILSPLAQIIQDSRSAVIGVHALTTSDYWSVYYLIYVLVFFIFVSGYFLFQNMASKFAEEV